MSDSYYLHHVFFCVNQRDPGEQCCQRYDALAMRTYMKKRCKALGLSGEGGTRINTAGCLGRCALGPVLVIYPDAVWYVWVDQTDIDEIIERHLQRGEVVERLRLV